MHDHVLSKTPKHLLVYVRYEGIVYLLNNFEQETTVCRENGGECKRDADAVRKYLGLRSTTDPLFQIEKVFSKVKYMDIDPDNLEAFFEATEDYNTAMNMSNSMAFISQFGEFFVLFELISANRYLPNTNSHYFSNTR